MTVEARFFLGVALWAGPVIAVMIRKLRVDAEYVRLYRQKHAVDLPVFSDEIAERYGDRPWRWPVEAPRLLARAYSIYSEEQDDPVLEAARQRSLRLERVVVPLVYLGVLWPILLFATAPT